jgi:hypothetical protein
MSSSSFLPKATNTSFRRADIVDKPLYVVTTTFNPQRYRKRWKNGGEFADRVLNAGAYLVDIEAAFGDRNDVIVEQKSDRHIIIHVRTNQEIWLKENMMNIAVQHIPSDWEYVAFIDADMDFARPDWVGEIIQKLQHHPVVQVFSEVVYLNDRYEEINRRLSFVERWKRGYMFHANGHTTQNNVFAPKKHNEHGGNAKCSYKDAKHGEWGPPGGGWAYRRKEFDAVGGMIDFCILGSADWYMAAGLIGFMEAAVPKSYTEDFKRLLMEWQKRAQQAFRMNIGVVKGLCMHHWHGKMSQRGYALRDNILKDGEFNPITDLKKDSYGLIQLHDDGSQRIWIMRNQISDYMESRNEDSLDD